MSEQIEITARLDEDGFLADPQDWDAGIAQALATRIGLGELDDAQWRIIEHIREQFQRTGKLPVQQTLCRELELEQDCILAHFGGPIEAWTVAGLPNPGEEAKVYMEDMEVEPDGTDASSKGDNSHS